MHHLLKVFSVAVLLALAGHVSIVAPGPAGERPAAADAVTATANDGNGDARHRP